VLTDAFRERKGVRSGRLGLLALGLGAFVVGTAELLVVGVLGLVARDLRVSVSTAGELVTAYALGISLGGPLLTAATIRLGRRTVVWLALAAYVAGNVVALAAASFGLLLVARILTGSVHGLFIGVAFAVAAGLVPAERQGQAMSVVMGGVTVAIVVGVPLGTAIGHALGWRSAFAVVVALGLVALAAALLFVPPVAARGAGDFRAQARAALAPRVLVVLAVGLLLMGGQFTAFTYLAPYLEHVAGVSAGAVSAFLLVFGVAAAAGTFIGGKAADRGAAVTLIAANVLLMAALALLYLLGSSPVLAAVLLAAWGFVGFGLVSALQLRVVTLAGAGGDLAATLGASAVNLGIAAGSLVGGAVLAGDGVHAIVLAGLVICTVALPATWASRKLKPVVGDRDQRTAPPQAPRSAARPAVQVGSER